MQITIPLLNVLNKINLICEINYSAFFLHKKLCKQNESLYNQALCMGCTHGWKSIQVLYYKEHNTKQWSPFNRQK